MIFIALKINDLRRMSVAVYLGCANFSTPKERFGIDLDGVTIGYAALHQTIGLMDPVGPLMLAPWGRQENGHWAARLNPSGSHAVDIGNC